MRPLLIPSPTHAADPTARPTNRTAERMGIAGADRRAGRLHAAKSAAPKIPTMAYAKKGGSPVGAALNATIAETAIGMLKGESREGTFVAIVRFAARAVGNSPAKTSDRESRVRLCSNCTDAA